VAVATISITWAGSNTAYTLLGSCNIGPAGSATSTTYIQFPATSTITPSANTGKAFAGTVTLTNGAQLPFAGFWQGGSVQIAVTGTAFLASYFLTGGSTKNFFCATTSSGSYLTLTNTGTSSASVGAISVTWAGSNTVYTGPNNCNIGAAGSSTATTYLLFPATNTITPSAISGQAFTGTVTLSDGEQLLFTGTWQ